MTNHTASPRKVMIVDAEQDLVTSAQTTLERRGYPANGFTEPEEAIKEFRRNHRRYALVISDIRMPGMGGFELARCIRTIRADAAVVLMTAFDISMPEFSRVFPSTPVDELIKKPVSSEMLVRIARKYVCVTE